jgi:hypothetical protein
VLRKRRGTHRSRQLFEKVALLFGQRFGDNNRDAHDHIAATSTAKVWNAFAAYHEVFAALSACWDFEFHLAIEGRDAELGAKGRLREVHREFEDDVIFDPLELFVRSD